MAARRIIQPAYDEHLRQASEMMHRGQFSHSMDTIPLSARLDNKLALQKAEIERLAADNHKLATSHLALREDLVAAEREVEKLREHIRSIQNEGDIQIRILLDKIAKMEADIRAGADKKKEVEEAHLEAQSLVASRRELTARIHQGNLELENVRANVKMIPELHAELDTLKQEHQRLRKTFEHEKGVNVEKVEQMKTMEKDLIAMYEEVERLRMDVLKAEQRAVAPIPYSTTPYMNPDNFYQIPFHGNVGYASGYDAPHLHMVGEATAQGMNQQSSQIAITPLVMNGSVINGTSGVPMWERTYDISYTKR